MPDWAREVRTRLSSLHLSSTREREVVDELSQHLDDRWRELIASGASSDEATELKRVHKCRTSRVPLIRGDQRREMLGGMSRKILLDENVPLGLLHALRAEGFTAGHIITLGWRGVSDGECSRPDE